MKYDIVFTKWSADEKLANIVKFICDQMLINCQFKRKDTNIIFRFSFIDQKIMTDFLNEKLFPIYPMGFSYVIYGFPVDFKKPLLVDDISDLSKIVQYEAEYIGTNFGLNREGLDHAIRFFQGKRAERKIYGMMNVDDFGKNGSDFIVNNNTLEEYIEQTINFSIR